MPFWLLLKLFILRGLQEQQTLFIYLIDIVHKLHYVRFRRANEINAHEI